MRPGQAPDGTETERPGDCKPVPPVGSADLTRAGPVTTDGWSSKHRCVLHVDMDAFFAAVEVKENPALSGQPVVVGGTGNRGVVASASYEARAFGIRSAMPAARARRLCPHLVFLPSRFELYQRYSERLHEVLHTFTPLVEGIGLDEAYLDISGASGLFGTPGEIAVQVRQRVRGELQLSCSVGAGPNKLTAKLASKAAKPLASRRGPLPGRGTVVVNEDAVLGFIWPMPVEALSGVGPANAARLHKLGVTTVEQLAALPVDAVATALGKAAGSFLHSLAWGRDPRPVEADRAIKSIGHEETYPTDSGRPGTAGATARHDGRLSCYQRPHARVRGADCYPQTSLRRLHHSDPQPHFCQPPNKWADLLGCSQSPAQLPGPKGRRPSSRAQRLRSCASRIVSG